MSSNHLDILRAELLKRRRMNPRYSLRSFARSLEMDPGNLSKVMAEKRGLPIVTAQKLADRLQLDSQQRHVFLSSVWTRDKTNSLNHVQQIDTDNLKRVDADFLRILNDWSDQALSQLAATLHRPVIYKDFGGVTGGISHLPARAGSPVILTVYGVAGAQCEPSWHTQFGTIFGTGFRVIFQSNTDFAGTATIVFSAKFNGKSMLQHTFNIPVVAARPTLSVTVTEHTEHGYAELQGQVELTQHKPQDLRVLVYPHRGQYLPPTSLAVDSNMHFCGKISFQDDIDRLAIQLTHRTFRPECDERIYVDFHGGTKAHLPFGVNDVDSLAFALHCPPTKRCHEDAQIQALQNRFFRTAIPNAARPAQLLRSFESLDLAFVYDQAIATIAFCHAGEKQDATHLLNALDHLQIKDSSESSGGWFASYTANGTPRTSFVKSSGQNSDIETSIPAKIARAGIVSWVAIAATAFQQTFRDTTYQPMRDRALRYLIRNFVKTPTLGRNSGGVRVLPFHKNSDSPMLSVHYNTEAYAAFRNAETAHRSQEYQNHASAIKRLIESMWDPELKGFYVSFDPDREVPNCTDIQLTPQVWSLLAFADNPESLRKYRDGLNLVFEHLFEPAGYLGQKHRAIPGFFDWRPMNTTLPNLSRQFVWSEATLATVLAITTVEQQLGEPIRFRRYGATYTAAKLLQAMNAFAEESGALPYCTGNIIRSDFQAEPSVCATAWLYFANHNINPLARPHAS